MNALPLGRNQVNKQCIPSWNKILPHPRGAPAESTLSSVGTLGLLKNWWMFYGLTLFMGMDLKRKQQTTKFVYHREYPKDQHFTIFEFLYQEALQFDVWVL